MEAPAARPGVHVLPSILRPGTLLFGIESKCVVALAAARWLAGSLSDKFYGPHDGDRRRVLGSL